MSKKQICLYTQTHWDREWYWEFEKYRNQLVSVARKIIDELESGSLPVFHLDGQTCALEDILEIEPELEDSIKALVKDRRLRIGPWYVLADQMLVSGESLVRNLERGMRIATKYGDPLMVGYCPDTFGHTQDMPRLLNGFGIENAIVWRGVPEIDEGPEFYWKSPDGSKVLGYLLPDGYYQTAFQETQYQGDESNPDNLTNYLLSWLGVTADGAQKDFSEREGRFRSYSKATGSSLVPVGGDHLYPPLDLSSLVEEAQANLDKLSLGSEVELKVVDLEEHLKLAFNSIDKPLELVRMIEGELRENSGSSAHCRAFMLPGVLSSRLYLKRENRLLENRLHQISEPLLATLWALGITRYPENELDNASKLLLLNHPHDSICGCSVDDVHNEMITRNRSINQALELLDRQIREEMLCPGVHEWSQRSEDKSSSSKFEQPYGFGRWLMDLNDPDAKVNGFTAFNFSGVDMDTPVPFKYSFLASKIGKTSKGHKSVLEQDEALLDVVSKELDSMLNKNLPRQIEEVSTQTEVFGAVGGVPVYKDVLVVTGYAQLGQIPKMGASIVLADAKIALKNRAYATSAVGKGSVAKSGGDSAGKSFDSNQSKEASLVSVDQSKALVSNKYFDVEFSGAGNLKVSLNTGSAKKEFNLSPEFYDLADAGDSYNFDPVFEDKPVKSRFKSIKFLKTGPLVAQVELVHEIDIAASIVESSDRKFLDALEDVDDIVSFKRSDKKIAHELRTKVTVKANCPILHFDTEWNNQSTDHRLEVRLNTGDKIKTTWSENHFSLVERKMGRAEVTLPVKRAYEAPLDRFPCQRFFVANGQVFLNKGLPEYSVDGEAAVITILRAFSMLSRKRLLTRGGGAGPHMPTPEGNCIGSNKVSYGWASLSSLTDEKVKGEALTSNQRALAYELAERFMSPTWVSPICEQFTEKLKDKVEIEDESLNLLDIPNSAIRVMAMYKTADQNELTLRLLNVTKENQQTDIKFAIPFKAIASTNLAGDKLVDLKVENKQVRLDFTVNELKTLKLTI